jgi:hypothetical protein
MYNVKTYEVIKSDIITKRQLGDISMLGACNLDVCNINKSENYECLDVPEKYKRKP